MKIVKVVLPVLIVVCLFSFTLPGIMQDKPIVLNEKDVAWADSVWKGTTMKDLQDGKELFLKGCNQCHKYHYPDQLNAEKWNKWIPKMAPKAGYDDKQQLSLLKFVVTVGRGTK